MILHYKKIFLIILSTYIWDKVVAVRIADNLSEEVNNFQATNSTKDAELVAEILATWEELSGYQQYQSKAFSGHCLAVRGEDRKIVVEVCNAKDELQRWQRIIRAGSPSRTIVHLRNEDSKDKCLASKFNGRDVEIVGCAPRDVPQLWRLHHLTENTEDFQVRSEFSDGKCLKVQRGRTVELVACDEVGNEGLFRLRGKQNG